MKLEGCDGEANAWYEDDAITLCYEYIEEIWKTFPSRPTDAGVTPIDALVAPVFDTVLHEFGHAIFEILKIPVFGREEDAADQVAAYIALQLGKDEARRLIGGTANAYMTEAKASDDAEHAASSTPTSTARPRSASTTCCASPTAPTRSCSATSPRRDICRRSAPRTARTNTSRPLSRSGR